MQNVLCDGAQTNQDTPGYLQDPGIIELNKVIASHPDADSLDVVDVYFEIFDPGFYMHNCMITTRQDYEIW